MRQPFEGIVAVTLFLAVGACGGDDNPMTPVDPGEEREILADPSFAEDIQDIIERRGCSASACHGSGAGGMTLTTSAAANHGSWVGIPAEAEPAFLRVEAGNPEDSYVVMKLEGRQTVGQRMPLGAPALDDIDLTNIRNWIAGGARNN